MLMKREFSLSTIEEQVCLFRSFFKVREDVISKYWKSKGGDKVKVGYSPLCQNKWDESLCGLSNKNDLEGGCRVCENTDYIPLSENLIKDHLVGRKILGGYPLLENNTCHFVAADFDKHKKTDPEPLPEVKKYVEACEVQEIPCTVFRSKSGEGYHVYIFFESAVPAWKARTVAFELLKEATVIGEDKEISSFDRLFPNQSRQAGKKLGNLIGLPFQGKACTENHTLPLDPETEFEKPYVDPWGAMENAERVTEGQLDTLIDDWRLQEDVPSHKASNTYPNREEKNLADFDRVKQGCLFLKHCCDDSEKLPEPEWYMFLTIVARCVNGRSLAHEYSRDYPAYDFEETEAKIEHALNDSGPYNCRTISELPNQKYCKKCSHRNKIKSPIVLGRNTVRGKDYTQATRAEFYSIQTGRYVPDNDEIYERVIKGLNEKHAGIMIGGKFQILNEDIDPVFNRPDFTLSSISDFKARYANKKIPDPDMPGKKISIAQFWFDHEDRRQYSGIVFDPSGNSPEELYNLWNGFSVEPKSGNWNLFYNHIVDVIANGKQSRAEWIFAWLARIVQDPGGNRPGTAIVLRGKQGTGKSFFVNTVGRIFSRHFLQLAQAKQVTGRFNHHLKDALMVFVDEGFWAGDKQAEGVIKNLITEPYLSIEQKGKDIIRVKNNVNLIMASNNDWIIPAGLEERRFFVIDVSDTYQQDHKYFKAITDQMKNGGLEAMLYDLLKKDISGIDLRTFEQTQGLFEQKLHSMDTVQKYWYERLVEGRLRANNSDDSKHTGAYTESDWNGEICNDDQYNDYLQFAKKLNDRKPLIKQQFGISIRKICPGVKKRRINSKGVRTYVSVFPSLEACRKKFCEICKMEIEWDDYDEI